MGTIEWLPIAENDVRRIYYYIAIDNEQAAENLVRRIHAKLETCLTFPRTGRARPQFGEGVRSASVGNFLVFYRAIPDGIRVLRLLDGRRDLDDAFFRED